MAERIPIQGTELREKLTQACSEALAASSFQPHLKGMKIVLDTADDHYKMEAHLSPGIGEFQADLDVIVRPAGATEEGDAIYTAALAMASAELTAQWATKQKEIELRAALLAASVLGQSDIAQARLDAQAAITAYDA